MKKTTYTLSDRRLHSLMLLGAVICRIYFTFDFYCFYGLETGTRPGCKHGQVSSEVVRGVDEASRGR